MYEMEGASLGRAVPGQPVAWPSGLCVAARWCRAPAADTGFPIPATSPRSFPREWCPFPTVKVFLLRQRASRKGLGQSYGEFFAVHTLSTECGWLSAVSEGYPPVYAQPFHRLPMVTRRIRRICIQDSFW